MRTTRGEFTSTLATSTLHYNIYTEGTPNIHYYIFLAISIVFYRFNIAKVSIQVISICDYWGEEVCIFRL